MSVPVALDALWERITEFGHCPYLVTVDPGGHAHVVSVSTNVNDGAIAVAAGNTSRANATANPAVTLLWPPVDDGPYGLIVDGTAEVLGDDDVIVHPTRAVLHRVADADDTLPTCVRLVPPRD